MIDAFDNTDSALYRALAGGVTTELLLHGSANVIGGQAVVIKNKFGLSRDQMLFPGAPRSIKFASGENPKRVYGDRNEMPSTRMGNFEIMRQSFEDAKAYIASWDAYNAKLAKNDKEAVAPKRDLKLEAPGNTVTKFAPSTMLWKCTRWAIRLRPRAQQLPPSPTGGDIRTKHGMPFRGTPP
jgi:hypothetical protein